jgi:hypothetical protein
MSTIANLFRYLLPEFDKIETTNWPPDVYCLAASALQASGSYFHVLQNWPRDCVPHCLTADAQRASGVYSPVLRNWPPECLSQGSQRWDAWAHRLSVKWRNLAAKGAAAPDEVRVRHSTELLDDLFQVLATSCRWRAREAEVPIGEDNFRARSADAEPNEFLVEGGFENEGGRCREELSAEVKENPMLLGVDLAVREDPRNKRTVSWRSSSAKWRRSLRRAGGC